MLNQSTHASVANSTASDVRHGPRRRMTFVLKSPITDLARACDLPLPGSAVSPNTSFSVEPVADGGNLGQPLVLKAAGPQTSIAPGFFSPVRLPLANPDDPENPLESFSGTDYRDNISNCNGVPVAIGDIIPNEPGNMIGPTMQGMQDLYD